MQLIVDGRVYEASLMGGIARVFNNLLPLICDIDQNLKVILFFNSTPKIPYPKHDQIKFVELFKVYKLRPWRLWRPYFHQIKSHYLRMFIGNTHRTIWMSTYFTRPSFIWQGKEVVWVHDMIYELFPDYFPNASDVIYKKKIALEAADKIFSNSTTTEKDLLNIYPHLNGKISALYLSHDPIFKMHQNSQYIKDLSDPFFLYVGKRSRYKGFDTLIGTFATWKRREHYKLVVVGEPWSLDEKEFIIQHKLINRVDLYERIDDVVLCELYNQAKAFIYPSLYEGFGIPLLEAMACGCPIIASRIPSTLEVASEVPIYFTPGNVESMSNAFDSLLIEDDLQERIKLGIEKASQYSWIKTAKAFYAVLQELYERT